MFPPTRKIIRHRRVSCLKILNFTPATAAEVSPLSQGQDTRAHNNCEIRLTDNENLLKKFPLVELSKRYGSRVSNDFVVIEVLKKKKKDREDEEEGGEEGCEEGGGGEG